MDKWIRKSLVGAVWLLVILVTVLLTLFCVWVKVPMEPLEVVLKQGVSFFAAASQWSGLFTLIAALYAGSKAVQVSRDRREEAEAAEFRDYMKWVAENIDLRSDDPHVLLKSNFGLDILYKYAQNPPSSLSEYDVQIARSLLSEVEDVSESFDGPEQFIELTEDEIQSIADEVLGDYRPQND